MTIPLEAYGAVYNYPNKGHDRLFLDNANRFFGVLDGAGGDELSEAIIQALPDAIERNSRLRTLSRPLFMANVVSEMDTLPEGRLRKSTAALACVSCGSQNTEITYANAGDSSVYLYNKTKDEFGRIAHTPTSYIRNNGRVYIDTKNFLGARRTPSEVAALIGHLTLPRFEEWSLVGMTDGVMDDDGQGITEASLEEMIRSTQSKYLPSTILDTFDKYDDASVFVIEHVTSTESKQF
jgi:hypothetical protein